MDAKVIHYTTQKTWKGLVSVPGSNLEPKRMIGKDGPFIFAYSTDGEEQWRNFKSPSGYPYLELFVGQFIANSGERPVVRLEADLKDDELGKVLVYDRAHMQKPEFRQFYMERHRRKLAGVSRDDIPKPAGWEQSERDYEASKTPFIGYKGGFGLPELAIPFPIPVARLQPTETLWFREWEVIRREPNQDNGAANPRKVFK